MTYLFHWSGKWPLPEPGSLANPGGPFFERDDLQMVANQNDGEFFRCPIPTERSFAELRLKRTRLMVQLQEASIDGFTVMVDSRDAGKLQMGIPWLILYDESKVEVHAEWFYHAADGHVQIGLRRLRDLTRPPRVHAWCPRFLRGSGDPNQRSGALLMSGILLIILTSLALPGIGDALGTSRPIQSALKAIVKEVHQIATRG